MELHDYLGILRKRRLSILIVTAVAVAGAAIWTMTATPTYRADSQVFVSVSTAGNTADLVQGSAFTQSRVKSYTDLATRPRVLLPVINQLHLTTSPDVLAGSITAENPLDTVLINISVTDTNPARAADIANAVAASLAAQVPLLEKPVGKEVSSVNVSSTQTATVPTSPASPKTKTDLGLGLLLGLALGIGLALLQETLDTKVRNEADVEAITDATVIGGIPFDPAAPKNPLIVQADPHSPRAEAFRTLRTNLQFVDAANHPRSIVFTSSVPGEGKTTTTANLAITMAAGGARICVVEGDLRRPRLLEYMGLDGSVGLTNVLIGQAGLGDALQQFAETSVYVIGAGSLPPNPSELLGSTAMIETLHELETRFDVVVIDSPPLLPVTDAAVLSTITGGTVVVVGAGKVNRDQLAKSLQSLETVKGRVLGLVLNMVPAKADGAYGSYRSGYAPKSARMAKSSRPRPKEREKSVS